MRIARSGMALAPVLGALLIAVAPAFAAPPGPLTAHATQHPMHQSGVMGRIEFTATPGGTMVTGTSTGLQPSFSRYVTLVYDLGSVPGGPTACEPTVPMPGMFVGIWSVDASGQGTLIQVAHDVAAVGTFKTVSIRDTTINGGRGEAAVLACGEVAVHGGAP